MLTQSHSPTILTVLAHLPSHIITLTHSPTHLSIPYTFAHVCTLTHSISHLQLIICHLFFILWTKICIFHQQLGFLTQHILWYVTLHHSIYIAAVHLIYSLFDFACLLVSNEPRWLMAYIHLKVSVYLCLHIFHTSPHFRLPLIAYWPIFLYPCW